MRVWVPGNLQSNNRYWILLLFYLLLFYWQTVNDNKHSLHNYDPTEVIEMAKKYEKEIEKLKKDRDTWKRIALRETARRVELEKRLKRATEEG